MNEYSRNLDSDLETLAENIEKGEYSLDGGGILKSGKTVSVDNLSGLDKKLRRSGKASIDNKGDLEYNELYTSTKEFVQKVSYSDREIFSRSLANKTSDMKRGERRTLSILGTTRNNITRVYIFIAGGYMHGVIKEKMLIKDDAESIRRRYKSGIDSDTEIVDLWSHPISDIGGEPNGDISHYEYGRETSDDDNVSSGQSASNRTRRTKRNGAYYKHDAVEVAEIVRRLSEKYNIPDDASTDISNPKIRRSGKPESESFEGDIPGEVVFKKLGIEDPLEELESRIETKGLSH